MYVHSLGTTGLQWHLIFKCPQTFRTRVKLSHGGVEVWLWEVNFYPLRWWMPGWMWCQVLLPNPWSMGLKNYPIISAIGSPTEKISEFLDLFSYSLFWCPFLLTLKTQDISFTSYNIQGRSPKGPCWLHVMSLLCTQISPLRKQSELLLIC